MQQWEYFTMSWDDIHKLNNRDINTYLNDTYGKNGWELISVAVYPHVQGGGGYGMDQKANYTEFSTILFFKRLK